MELDATGDAQRRRLSRTSSSGRCHSPGQTLTFVQMGKPLDRLMVIHSGKACAVVDGRHVTELEPGHFIGSISYVTEETAPSDVVALELTRYVSWPKAKLKNFMTKNPELHSALKSTLAIDLTRWLQATWVRGARQNATRTDPV